MKKLLFLLFFGVYPVFSSSVINECKIDVYFANGILTEEEDAEKNARLLEEALVTKLGIEHYNKQIDKVDYAYNSTVGMFGDLLESANQIFDLNELEEQIEKDKQTIHDIDLDLQVKKYKKSILDGHKILVVAHSQGNLFTREAYLKLGFESKNSWMQNYFEAISVASPDFTDVIKLNTTEIGWDNDIVAWLGNGLSNSGLSSSEIRKISWERVGGSGDDSATSPLSPYANYTSQDYIGKILEFQDGVQTIQYQANEGGLDSNVHAFTFYMGEPLREGDESKSNYGQSYRNPFTQNEMIDTSAKSKIMTAISQKLDILKKVPSQWKKDESFQEESCDYKITVKHKHDNTFDALMSGIKVYPFAEDKKLYQVGDEWVKASCGGTSIEELAQKCDASALKECWILEGTQEKIDVSCCDNHSITPPSGLFQAQLKWNKHAVDLQMSSPLMSESTSGCGINALGSGTLSLYSVYPGTYPIKVSATGYEKYANQEISDTITLDITAVNANSHDRFTVTNPYQYPNLGNNGYLADIVISRDDPTKAPVVEAIPKISQDIVNQTNYNYRPVSYPHRGIPDTSYNYQSAVSNTAPNVSYNPPPELCNKSCGCLPCQYAIISYLNQARLGPISGAKVRLYKATEEHKADREILYEGITSIGTKIENTGVISLPIPYPQQPLLSAEEQLFLEKIGGYDGDFILEIGGGFDIDKNDDLIVDSKFTQLNGKLHLILDKKSLLNNDYKVNILTEIAYQLSQDLLGENYDQIRLQERLDMIAKKVLIDKLYPTAEKVLGRSDLFYWIPAAHKKWLIKPYDITLAPIVEKLYRGENIYADAYDFVYDPLDPIAYDILEPVLSSKWIKVDEDETGEIVVGQVVPKSSGNSAIRSYTLSGEGSEKFDVKIDGSIVLKEGAVLDFETTNLYQIELRADNSEGSSRPVTLYVVVGNVLDSPEDTGFEGGIISEDASSGDQVGIIHFDAGASAIERIEIGGADKESFEVDLEGKITLSESATLDYESKNYAEITIQAFNAQGSSRVISVVFSIVDAIDVPIVQKADLHLLEDALVDQVVGKVSILSNDPILAVSLAGEGSDAFTIDLDGTVKVSQTASLDYEVRQNYVLNVLAENSQGLSKYGTLIVRLDNVVDVPELNYTQLRMYEYTEIGAVIGTVNVKNVGSSEIAGYTLSGEGSENFQIDELGQISVQNGQISQTEQEYFYLYTTATNSSGTSYKVPVVVYIDTKRPRLGTLDSYVYENTLVKTRVGEVPVASTYTPITTIRIEGEGSEKFMVNSDLEVFTVENAVFDFEVKDRYVFEVFATNSYGESDPIPMYIRVIDRIDTIKISSFSTTIYEDIPINTIIGTVSTLETAGEIIESFVIRGEGSENFVVSETGVVSIAENAMFDSVTAPRYHLEVKALAESGQESNSVYVDISVAKSINTIPSIDDIHLTISEDVSINDTVGKATITSKAYIIEQAWITGEGASVFSIDQDGMITVNDTLDFETKQSYTLQLYARNTLGHSLPALLTIDVLNVIDDEPVLINTNVSVDENLPVGEVVGQVNIQQVGKSPIQEMVITGSGTDLFNIDNQGVITLRGNLDYETTRVYTLLVKADNGIAMSNEVRLRVDVKNIPDIPPSITPVTLSINENEAPNILIGQLTLQQGDSPISAIRLIGEGADKFDLSLEGTLRAKVSFDYEVQAVYTLQVIAENLAGESNYAEIVINIVDVDEIKPTVISVTPETGQIDVPVNRNILVTFSESILLDSLNNINFAVKSESGQRVEGEITLRSAEVTFEPYEPLSYDTKYIVTLSTEITDLHMNNLEGEYITDFTTVREVNSTDITNGLLAHFKFEQNTYDSSGNNNDGVASGNLEYTEGPLGLSAKFSGNENIKLPIELTSELENQYVSIAFWGKAADMKHQIFITNTDYGDGSNSLFMSADSAGVRGSCANTREPMMINQYANNWHHYTFTYDNQVQKLYIDGVLVKEETIGTNAIGGVGCDNRSDNDYDRYLNIGSYNNTFSSYTGYTEIVNGSKLIGNIDDLRIYNRVLDDDTIDEIYKLGNNEPNNVQIFLNEINDFEIIGTPNVQYNDEKGIWFNSQGWGTENEANYLKYTLPQDIGIVHVQMNISGHYNIPENSLGNVQLIALYKDGSTYTLASLTDAHANAIRGQSFIVNDTTIYYLKQKIYENYQIDVDIPIEKQHDIESIYLKGGAYLQYPHSVHYIKDIVLTTNRTE
ncbi:MAG: Ig-like domain-containing protein [Epsilonproteobacteria bacterium]|nr:Ig-like domain-containing protein [Campylobacterota bacterium]